MRPWLAAAMFAAIAGPAWPLETPGAGPSPGGADSFAGLTARPFDPAAIAALTDFVRAAMSELGVPGAALAVVDHGTVVFEGGLGVRTLGRPETVDARTRFMIGANTRGLTSLLLARLADQGRFDWDEPVVRAWPAFRLGDEAASAGVRMRDLACACQKPPHQDLAWRLAMPPGTPASAVFARLAALGPGEPADEMLTMAAAGYIGAHLARPRLEVGDAFDAVMQQEILKPLATTDTTFDMAAALAGDHAGPHGADLDGRPAAAAIELDYGLLPSRPGGGAWSSAHDLARYAAVELSGGLTPEGARLVSPAAMQLRSGASDSRGLGLSLDRSFGVAVLHRGGGAPGFAAEVFVVPDAQLAAVILTNAETGERLMRPFLQRLLELGYGGVDRASGEITAAGARLAGDAAAERARWTAPPDPGAIADLAADYANPTLGRISLRREGAEVVFDFGAWRSRMASRRGDDGTITLATISPAAGRFEFVAGRRAGRRVLILRDGAAEYVYQEVG